MARQSLAARFRGQIPLEAKHAALSALNTPFDLHRTTQWPTTESRSSSVQLIASMSRARRFRTPLGVLNHALSCAPATGLVAEFGVYSGATLRRIAARRPGAHGFDSFEGLPEDWRGPYRRGTFAVDRIPRVDDATLHVGWFENTVAPFLAETPGPAAFLHLDADLYSSTATVLSAFADRIVPGTVLVFDEYFNYPGWQAHEHKAFSEFVARTGVGFDYLAYNSRGQQVAVRIRDTLHE
ncbi:class I SAM-dependent methyltransferase [Tomitella gaofuii]|uniref:class I SAM-dependent methyltransferase n=1 Tax=Tomitella gaofuii TaxID=2760083 RepID=UPI001F31A20B|nr:class I SAM-dependent methyltransferase [Tomitella gaofuii]